MYCAKVFTYIPLISLHTLVAKQYFKGQQLAYN